MNNEGSHRYGEHSGKERAVELLRDAVTRLEASRGDPGESVERSLARGTDRLFSCDSPLGEVYVGVSEGGVRLVGGLPRPEEFARRYRERFGWLLSWGTDERTRRLAERVAACARR
jgi:methylated-DNA-[protein]-cysteine S-methyltransferase